MLDEKTEATNPSEGQEEQYRSTPEVQNLPAEADPPAGQGTEIAHSAEEPATVEDQSIAESTGEAGSDGLEQATPAPLAEAANAEPAAAPASHDMGVLLEQMESQYRAPRRGEVIEGTIVSIDNEGALVDIGSKSEGLIPANELEPDEKLGEVIEVGSKVLVYVVQGEDRDGHVALSLRRARNERAWRLMQRKMEENATLEARIVDVNRGGVIVNILGLRGFVPISQAIGYRPPVAEAGEDQPPHPLIGNEVSLKILEVNRRRNRLILSQRLAVQEQRQQRKDELIATLTPGEVVTGRVSSICDFGAFVDVGGADGLVHITELCWSPTSSVADVVQVGQEIEVLVLSVDAEKRKIALSLRRAQPEPWSTVEDRFHAGDEVKAQVAKLATFGAFVRVADGIEGLVHISELSDRSITNPRQVVSEGDVVMVKVLRVEPERRRLGLSLRQADQSVLEQAAEEEPVAEATEPESSVELQSTAEAESQTGDEPAANQADASAPEGDAPAAETNEQPPAEPLPDTEAASAAAGEVDEPATGPAASPDQATGEAANNEDITTRQEYLADNG